MKLQQPSIFNLIEIFSKPRSGHTTSINAVAHCEQKHHHDFYCDAEKPFVSI